MNIRKLFGYSILALVVIGMVAWLANYLSTGTIQINATNKNDTITLQKTSGGQPFTRISTGSLKVTVKHGRYTATIKNGLKTTIQVIAFNSGHKSFRYSAALKDLQPSEVVSYQRAQDVAASNSELSYLDGSPGILYKIDGQNNLQKINRTQQFKSVAWASPTFGVGQGSDGRLYTISGNSIVSLAVPFPYDGKVINFDVSADKRIYISHGSAVYASNQPGEFKKIYTASSTDPTLVSGSNGVAVADTKYGPKAGNISKPLLAIVDVSGKVTKKHVEAEHIEWSPGGQYIAVVNQANLLVYNTSLHQTAIIPASAVVGQFGWQNNNTLLYTSSYQIWSYKLSEQKIQLLADTSTTDSLRSMSVSSDGSYVYLTVLDPFSFNYAIKRISLKDQPIPSYIHKLQDLLPEKLPSYSINMVNFSAPPAILVQPVSGNSTSSYTQEAQNKLQGQGIEAAMLRFEAVAPVTDNID